MPYVCRRCCCGIASDNFNRDDDTDIGPKWSEVSGDWEIVSNTLRCDDTSATAICSAAGERDRNFVASVTMTGASGDKSRLIVAYEDSNNYWFAEITFGSNFRLYKRTAGSDSQEASYTGTSAGQTYKVQLCVGEEDIMRAALFNSSDSKLEEFHVPFIGIAEGGIGVGTGGTASSSIAFDDFSVKKVSEKCEQCSIACVACTEESATPPYWDVEFPDFDLAHAGTLCDDSCALWESSTVRLSFVGKAANPNHCRWCASLSCGSDFLVAILTVAAGSGGSVSLSLHISDSACGGPGVVNARFSQWGVPSAVGDPVDCSDTYVLNFGGQTNPTACRIPGSPTVTVTPVY